MITAFSQSISYSLQLFYMERFLKAPSDSYEYGHLE